MSVSLALIGAGNFARHLHLPNCARLTGAQLKLVVDINEDTCAAVADRWQVQTSTDVATALNDPSIDGVIIAVRDDLQAALACQALAAGKHVYVEKPLAETPEACEPVIAARQQAERLLAVGFNRRFAPAYTRLKQLILADNGAKNIQLRMCDDAWRWAHGYPPGHLIKHDICHLFDLIPWLSGSSEQQVCAMQSRDDDDAMLLQLANGCVATITSSGHGTMPMPKEHIHVMSERGGVSMTDFVELWHYNQQMGTSLETFEGHEQHGRAFPPASLYKEGGLAALRDVRERGWNARYGDGYDDERDFTNLIPNFTRNQGWLAALQGFVDAIATGAISTEHASAEDALAAARVADAVVRSRAGAGLIEL